MHEREPPAIVTSMLELGRSTAARRYTAQAFTLAGSQFGAAAIGLITTIVVARALGPERYGLAVVVMSYPALLWSALSFKPATVAARYVAILRSGRRSDELIAVCKLGYGLDVASACLVALVVALTSSWAAQHLSGYRDMAAVMVAFGASFVPFALSGTSQAILTGWQMFKWLASFNLAERGLQLALMVAFLMFGLGVRGVVLASGLAQACLGVTLAASVARLLRAEGISEWWHASLGAIRQIRRELASLVGWNYLLVTLTGIMDNLPLLLLTRLAGPSDAGYFRLATTLMTTASYLEVSLASVALPVIASHWEKGDRKELKVAFRQWTRGQGLLAAALVLLAIPLLPFLLPILLGSQYGQVGLSGQLLLGAVAAVTPFFWTNPYFLVTGRMKVLVKAYGLYALLVMSVGGVLSVQWGFRGLAVAVAVARVLYGALLASLARRDLR